MSEENLKENASDNLADKKFIRGDYGLGFTFWGGGFGVTFILLFCVGSILDSTGGEGFAYFAMALFFLYSIFISIAIWRASNQYIGPVHWGVLSKIAVIFTLGLVLLIYMYFFAMLSSPPMH